MCMQHCALEDMCNVDYLRYGCTCCGVQGSDGFLCSGLLVVLSILACLQHVSSMLKSMCRMLPCEVLQRTCQQERCEWLPVLLYQLVLVHRCQCIAPAWRACMMFSMVANVGTCKPLLKGNSCSYELRNHPTREKPSTTGGATEDGNIGWQRCKMQQNEWADLRC
jgi:hypothetical protein